MVEWAVEDPLIKETQLKGQADRKGFLGFGT